LSLIHYLMYQSHFKHPKSKSLDLIVGVKTF